MKTDEHAYLTRAELAERLRFPRQTLANWACEGRGPKPRYFGRVTRYAMADVLAFEANPEAFGLGRPKANARRQRAGK